MTSLEPRNTPHTDPGARPLGTHTEAESAAQVQHMFRAIAPTYDRANHLLSFGLDRLWWRRAAHTLRPILLRPEARILDLCCGTGDLTAALLRERPAHAAPILGGDFAPEMLARARQKHAATSIRWSEMDAMRLPLPDRSLDLVTFAFGFRNLPNYAAGLAESFRVLAPGGTLAILECNQPGGLTGAFYSLYFKRILPVLGGWISGNPAAYRYLPASVERFPRPPRMLTLLREAGFPTPRWIGYTFGTAGLYLAQRAPSVASRTNGAPASM